MNPFPLLKPPLHYSSSWELKERSLSLAKSSLLCMLVHSYPLYAWAFNSRASPFYRGYNPSMAPWWIPCGTTTTRSLLNFTSSQSKTLRIIKSLSWPKAKDKHSLACRGCYLVYHIENGHFTLAETTESLKINEALKFLSTGWKLVIFKYQTSETYCKSKISARPLV